MSEQSSLPALTFKDVAQPIFDKVWERAKNKTRAKDATSGHCKYRVKRHLGTIENNACFIGVCMTDEEYKPAFEGKPTNEIWGQGLWFPKGLLQIADREQRKELKNLCADLQTIHDAISPGFWQQKLRELAHSYNLTIPTDKETTNDAS